MGRSGPMFARAWCDAPHVILPAVTASRHRFSIAIKQFESGSATG
jgi:hypothetical protein